MDITGVRIKLADDPSGHDRERLRAFASVELGGAFVVHDIKVIEGSRGAFVAMPSRKVTDRCDRCGTKNHLRARYCNQCGQHLDPDRAPRALDGRAILHADVAHPINNDSRYAVELAVLAAYRDETCRATNPRGEACHARPTPA